MTEFAFVFHISLNKLRSFQIIFFIQSIGSLDIMQIPICMVGIILFRLRRIYGFGLRHNSRYLLERLTKKDGNKGWRDMNNNNDEDQKK